LIKKKGGKQYPQTALSNEKEKKGREYTPKTNARTRERTKINTTWRTIAMKGQINRVLQGKGGKESIQNKQKGSTITSRIGYR